MGKSDIILEVFGKFCLDFAQENLHLSRRKSQAIVTILSLSPSQSESRSRLCNLLWSNNTESKSRVSLRQELAHLKKNALINNIQLINADNLTIWLSKRDLIPNSLSFIAQIKTGMVPDELISQKFPQEILLSHIEDLDDELDAWIRVERGSFERVAMAALTDLINQNVDAKTTERASLALLNFDPTDEHAVKTAIEVQLHKGGQSKANSIFKDYCSHLKNDHGLEPSQVVINTISQTVEPVSAPISKKVVHSTVQNQRALILAHPVSDSLLTSSVGQQLQAFRISLLGSLARFRDWSVREFTDHDHEMIKATSTYRSFELIFEGMESRDGSVLTITLLEKHTREYVWSETVEARRDDVIQTQKLTVQKLAAALNLQISARRLENTLGKNENELDQYDRWLLAKQLLSNWNAEDEAKAETILRSLLVKWPSYAPALSGLVEIFNTRHHIFPGVLPDNKRTQEALKLAKKAVRISPQDNRTHLSLGWCQLMSGNREQAIYSFDLALQINEYDPLTVISSAMGYCYAGAKVQALETAKQALLISAGGEPIHWAYHCCIRFYIEDFEGAWSAAQHAAGSAFFVDAMRIAILGQLGQIDLATNEISDFRELISNNWFSSKPPNNKNIRHWLMCSFPISVESDREILSYGLDVAGFV